MAKAKLCSSPTRYHGGKNYLAPWIRSFFPAHLRYCEPYFGGGSVLFASDGVGVAEYVNDLDWGLINFWKVLADPLSFKKFKRQIEATPFSTYEFEAAACSFEPKTSWSVPHAVWFFIRNRQSRQGLGEDFATPTSRLRRNMNENVSAWLSSVAGLPEVHARLQRVEIRNTRAIAFIASLDSADTLFYCDPPYLGVTRTAKKVYRHEMTEKNHSRLLTCLGGIKGKFLLSGYDSLLYRTAAAEYGWYSVRKQIDNKSSSKQVKDVKTECLWMNFEPEVKRA